MNRRRGFTLVEILVAVMLMVILISAVTKIFMDTTEVVARSEARNTIYGNARYALDQMTNDIHGFLSLTGGQQRFILENGSVNGLPPAMPVAGPGHHTKEAGDFIKFRSVTGVGNTTQMVEVSYHLIPGDKVLWPSSGSLPDSLRDLQAPPEGDPARGKTVSPERPLYTLVRRVRTQDPANPLNWDQVPKDSNGRDVPDQEVAYFVISFNIEFMANDASFSQLDAPLPDNSPCPPSDPLGESADKDSGTNDGKGGAPALRIPGLRITLVIVEDVKALQERVIQRVIWIPMG